MRTKTAAALGAHVSAGIEESSFMSRSNFTRGLHHRTAIPLNAISTQTHLNFSSIAAGEMGRKNRRAAPPCKARRLFAHITMQKNCKRIPKLQDTPLYKTRFAYGSTGYARSQSPGCGSPLSPPEPAEKPQECLVTKRSLDCAEIHFAHFLLPAATCQPVKASR